MATLPVLRASGGAARLEPGRAAKEGDRLIVFRHARSRLPLATLLNEVAAYLPAASPAGSGPGLPAFCPPVRDAPLRLLLAAGALECALSDYWGAKRDTFGPAHQAALALSRAAAEAYLGLPQILCPAAAWVALQPWLPPPATVVTASRPEGFRYYALRPSAYVEPARRLAASIPPGPVLVIGLRTIGSSLAPVVAAVAQASGRFCELLTLRPRGRPEDRAYAADALVLRRIRHWPGEVAVVDEGPGLSGSSFGGAVRWLQAMGIQPRRISLLPSWNPPAERLSHTVVAQEWDHWRKFPATQIQPDPAWGIELSGGRWRALLAHFHRVPVWPQEERVKFLSHDRRWVFKFSGLGAANAEAAHRSACLAQHGFSIAGVTEGEGWLRFPWLNTRPLAAGCFEPRRWAEWAGHYFAFLRSRFALGSPEPPSPELREMAATNVAAFTGRMPPPLPPDAPLVRLDGRLLRYEWALGAGGKFLKLDALDHGDDHFFPGPADIAWDLAGLECEFGAPLAGAAQVAYIQRSGDRDLAQRLPWYRVAYAAFRAAFADFAQELVAPPDRDGFIRQRECYLRHLRQALAASA